MTKQRETRMGASLTLAKDRFEMPGRFAATIECADDLTPEEITIAIAWFETKVSLLQRRERGYTDEEAIRWQNEAAGVVE